MLKKISALMLMPAIVFGLLITWTIPGWALTITEDPRTGGSWFQKFMEGGKDFSFDRMEVYMISGDSVFERSGFENISVADWEGQVLTPSSGAIAFGTAVDKISFDLHFSGNLADPLAFKFYAYLDGNPVPVDFAIATWSGSAWTIEPVDLAPANVPIPGAMLLLGVGLARLAAYRRGRI